MIQAEIADLSKKYGKEVVINDLNLRINKGEVLAVVGPSGCGKTTLLQIIAGLTGAEKGSVVLAGRTLLSVERNISVLPEKRKIAMVFQNYALWPHYNVWQNISYALRVRGVEKSKCEKIVKETMEMVRLEGKQKRYPHELSGGEQQRVALARALVIRPDLLLFDESLSNLDAKMKEKMLREIKKIQQELRLTIVHVTHDQHEAMGMADRIAVMNKGRIEQVGVVEEVYKYPVTQFVAGFIGTANFISGSSDDITESKLWRRAVRAAGNENEIQEKEKLLSVRPEDVIIKREKGEIIGTVAKAIYRGNAIDYEIMAGKRLLYVRTGTRNLYELGAEVSIDMVRAVAIKCN